MRSSELARRITKFYFDTIFSRTLGSQISIESELLFAADIFTPSPRLKRNIVKLNNLLDNFLKNYVPASYRENHINQLAVLSMFLMASKPVTNGLTCLFNHLLNDDISPTGCNENWFSTYSMAPTIFVARRVAANCFLGDVEIKKHDIVYVFLTEFSGCPFTSSNVLPFGFGKHLCPGLNLSKIIMDTTLNFAKVRRNTLRDHLVPAELVQGLPTAFLVYD